MARLSYFGESGPAAAGPRDAKNNRGSAAQLLTSSDGALDPPKQKATKEAKICPDQGAPPTSAV
jgi:hypothetical protein